MIAVEHDKRETQEWMEPKVASPVAVPRVESIKSCQSVNSYCESEPGEFSRVEAN